MPNSTTADPTSAPTLHLERWTVTSGSNARSRGAVIIDAGDHHWRASADGNGAIDALYRAVDQALAEVLDGHPRLMAYDIHALGEGTDTIGAVTVRIAPPDVGGKRGSGEYVGEAHWTGAPEAAAATGKRARAKAPVSAGAARERRAKLDTDAGEIDTTDWFNRQG